MFYHRIAVNAPLPPLTYSAPQLLPAGTRVCVPFRRKNVTGVVWESGVAADMDTARILPVAQVFDGEPLLPESWRGLIDFAARYYHHPLGQTVFAALPQSLREAKAHAVPVPEPHYALTEAGRQQPPPPPRFVKKHALWTALSAGGGTLAALKRHDGQAAARLAQWQHDGWVAAAVPSEPPLPPPSYVLNAAQAAAAAQIQAACGTFQPFLLYGITGSGKTEVYFEAMAQVLASGKQVLMLLPEINLTPQLLERLRRRFGSLPTAVLHSRAAAGQRGRDYLRALSGQARLIVGTRLAVFTPLHDVGLIVVDEEHDPSFKQDSDLRYHARDLAVWRARQAGCPIVLGSATPSLESWYKAKSGAYRLLTLPQRARDGAQPPQVEILDVRRLRLDNGISAAVSAALADNFRKGGLSLVYLNRRGFAPALFCADCGHTFGCTHCSAKMVLHQRQGQIRCHHCGFRQPVPPQCPQCGNQDLSALGQGTQRVEETLRLALPQARIVRVDRDSVSGAHDWDALYADIGRDGADILVGTQMLAKGHDFARLNLVVVLNADGSLYSSDFRAPERLFAELMQVSGRAGRADAEGRVIIQTALPEHPLFAAVRAQDYAAFADEQLAERALFAMPPCGFQAAVRADAPLLADAADCLAQISEQLSPLLPESVTQLGPVPMLLTRLAGRERAQLFLESASRRDLHRAAAWWAQALREQAKAAVRWHIDIDPQEM